MTQHRFALCLFAVSATAALAVEPLPKTSGWNGYVSPSVSAMSFRDNQLAGAGPLDVGTPRIESLSAKPEKESTGSASLTGEVGYMFAEQGLYLFLGNRLEDFLRLDNSSALGARLDLGGPGILEASAIFASVPTEVWEDPFLTGADREETDRSSHGARIGLANILGSKLEAHVTVRTVEIDTERSGASLDLTSEERDLLARDGDSVKAELLYTWLINDRHLLVPAVDVGAYDADGDAISRTGAGLQLTHAYRQGRYRLVSNLALRQTSFDEANPVFDEKQDETEVVASVTGFYGNLFNQPGLAGMATLLHAKRDSKITFYDAEATVATLGVLYNF